MNEIRTVIWDCDNVMWFHKKEEPQIIAKALGISEVEEFSSEFYGFIEKFSVFFRNKKVNMKETLKLIEETMPIVAIYNITPEGFMKVFEEKKLETKDFNSDTLIVMQYLRNKGIKCIIKSDWFRSTQEVLLKAYGILEYIEELHCCDNSYLKSCQEAAVELIKPGQEEQYVIIGDSLNSDIAFAKNAGIKSIWLNKNHKENKTAYKPDFEITSLLDVMKII